MPSKPTTSRKSPDFPQEVQQEEAPVVQPVVVENVAFFPGLSGLP